MAIRTTLFAAVATTSLLTTAAFADPNKIGFIYVDPTADFGYNMSMDLGRQYLEENISRPARTQDMTELAAEMSRRGPRRALLVA